MGILDRLVRRLKGIGDMPYPDESHWRPLITGRSSRIVLPGSHVDWRAKAGQPWLNSAAWIGMNWIAQSFPEAPLAVVHETADGGDYDTDHPLCQLWRHPNAAYQSGPLVSGVVLSLLSDGNAYLQKVRGRAGELGAPVELYWLPHWRMEPVSDKGSRKLIERYELTQPDGSKEQYRVEDIVHVRYGLDPENTRKGMAPLKPILREIASDNEATTFVAAILANMGIPGVILSTKDPTADIPRDEAERIKELFQQRTTGDERGRPLVIPAPIQVDSLGMSPNELALTALIEQSIARILAALGLSAMAVGLPDSQRTYSNYGEALKAAWENAVTPLMATIGDALDAQLLPEYKPLPTDHVEFDLRDVQALQESATDVHTRARQNYVAGIWKRSEARAETGLDYGPEDEVYADELKAAAQMAALDRQAEIASSQAQSAAQQPPKEQPEQSAGKSHDPEDELPSPWVERVMQEIAALGERDAQES